MVMKPLLRPQLRPQLKPQPLLNTRFREMARNTIDYWMVPSADELDPESLRRAMAEAPVPPGASLQLYLHVPFCAQACSFCAFSGGNSLAFAEAQKYSALLIRQMRRFLDLLPTLGMPIRSVHIGGGSPDLLRGAIVPVLESVRALPGFCDDTELAVECALSTARPDFLEALCEAKVTKLSFGIQSIDPAIRRHVRLPAFADRLEALLERVAGRIPVINADLITGLPGQDLAIVDRDLRFFLDHPGVNAISSYLCTAGAAPAMVADILNGAAPSSPTPELQARMRLHSYGLLRERGWRRKGTNTYLDPMAIAPEIMEQISGNECIGGARYESFLVGLGCQAVGSIPGARLENKVDLGQWSSSIEAGGLGLDPRKSALRHQRDMALWTFPLRAKGLSRPVFEKLLAEDLLSKGQRERLRSFIDEGLIIEHGGGLELSILGEVFMGHLVRGLKKEADQGVIDAYIDEGFALAEAIATGKIPRENQANNRQISDAFLDV